MPKNTLKFWKNLRREKLNNTNCLASVRFTIFGLGDSSYLKYSSPFSHPSQCLFARAGQNGPGSRSLARLSVQVGVAN